MKMKITVLLAIFLSFQAGADEAKQDEENNGSWQVGANYLVSISGTAKAEISQGVLDLTVEEDIKRSDFSVYGGYRTTSNNLFTISYARADIDFEESDSSSETVTGVDFDWQFIYEKRDVDPYWGIGFGFHTIDEALILNGTDKEGDSLSGASVQLMAGLKVDLAERAELDVSLKHKTYSWQEVTLIPVGAQPVGGNLKVETSYSTLGLNVGIGYKF